MRLFLMFLVATLSLSASMIKAPVMDVEGEYGYIQISQIQEGVSGFLVRQLNDDHSVIIANVLVVDFNATASQAKLKFSPYSGLKQTALPKGVWKPQNGDEAQLAFAYNRALLIAPNRVVYNDITSRATTIDWIHADTFAATLSYHGHPTPLAEDMQTFCNVSTIGLLYIYAQDTLFTLDCKSMNVLQITTVKHDHQAEQLPFYSRIDTIREAWWGEGSDTLKSYDSYYMEMIKKHNKQNRLFKEFIKFDAIDQRPELKISTVNEGE